MRIALVAQEYPPETAKGGIGVQAHLKAHGLAARGHDVQVISRAPDGVRSERMDGPVRLLRIPGFEKRMPVYTEVADWITYSAEVCAAVHALHAEKPLDLVEFPEWAAEGYVYLSNRSGWDQVPAVVHIHGPLAMFARTIGWPDPASAFFRIGSAMEAACLRLADAVYSSSAYSAGWCAREYGVDGAGIPVMHTGVDTKCFCPQPVPRDSRPTIVYTGKLVRNKGVLDLVAAACRLVPTWPDLRLLLVGRGEEGVIREIRALAAAEGCSGLLELPGFLPRENLPDLLSRGHVFAAPSPFEGGPGFMFLEAMACGLPVIACAGSGGAEMVLPEETGLLVPPGDPEALARALEKLLGDQDLREQMGRQARRHMMEQADSKKCLDRIEHFFISVAAKTASGGGG